MDTRKSLSMVAAVIVGAGLVGAAAAEASPRKHVIVKATRLDPNLQRTVSYRDLNLASLPDQKVLRGRIRHTAGNLCRGLDREPSERTSPHRRSMRTDIQDT